MGWIGISDMTSGGQSAGLTRLRSNRGLAGSGLIAVGTLMTEIVASARPDRAQTLFGHESESGWRRAFRMTLGADGRLALTMQQGTATFRVALALVPPSPGDIIRVTYSWDAPRRMALISAENLDQETLFQADAPAPLPLPSEDARALLVPQACCGGATRYVALSDRVEPVGLPAGFLQGTPVETASGPKLVERLAPGDLLPTASGKLAQLRWVARRDVPALGRYRPIRLRAPYFGLQSSLCVAGDHRILIENAEAEYLFGEDTVLVQARDLVDGQAAQRLPGQARVVTFYHLLFDQHECVQSHGLWSESLFVGGVARQPALLRTTPLAGLAIEDVPRHRHHAHAQLSSREAHSLSRSMAS